MDKKVTGIVGYLTWIGWIVAYYAGDRERARFHLNQSLVLWIFELVIITVMKITHFIPLVGWSIRLAASICQIVWIALLIIAFIGAWKEEETPIPWIGEIQILK